MGDLRIKRAFMRSFGRNESHYVLFRVMWEVGETRHIGEDDDAGDCDGYSNKVSVSLQPKLFRFQREYVGWVLIVCGIRIHRKWSYGGKFT